MRILDIALKDLTQILRDKRSLLFLVAMPVAFTIFMGFAYKGTASGEQDNRLPVGWINLDANGPLSQELHKMLSTSDSIRLVEIAPDSAGDTDNQVLSGQLAASLTIPAGFSADALAGNSPQIVLVADPASNTGQSILQIVRVPVTRLMSSVEIALLYTQSVSSADASVTQATFLEAAGRWMQAEATGAQLITEKAQGKQQGAAFGGNPYNQTSPGIMVQFAIFSLVTSATILVQERKTRTLERMLTTSLNRTAVVAGHFLAMFVLVLMEEGFLVVFGQLVLKVSYFQEALGTLLVVVTAALWAASLGLFIGVMAKSEQQAVLYSLIAMFVFSGLGGTWFPLESSGRAFSFVGKLMPSAWAMTGFQNILIRGLGLASALLPAAILLVWTAGFFGLAAVVFRKVEQ